MLSDKKLQKIEKILGKDRVSEMEGSSEAALRLHIMINAKAIKQAAEELEANEVYQPLKESVKAVSEGFKEVKKHSTAAIQYSLHLLEQKGCRHPVFFTSIRTKR